ncbi:hypothetical protein GLYMA_15G222900v4 [Glycine max]|uniref:Uncharacterized protein n=1 Tax=Glycine max TaxID=3847 RepID=I1MIH9_SOYBN|nr:hypothetical protein GLYMA_15G222900v4 [Glycine max]
MPWCHYLPNCRRWKHITSACGLSDNGIPGIFALLASDLFLLTWISSFGRDSFFTTNTVSSIKSNSLLATSLSTSVSLSLLSLVVEFSPSISTMTLDCSPFCSLYVLILVSDHFRPIEKHCCLS